MPNNLFRYVKKDDSFFVSPPFTCHLQNNLNKETKIEEQDLEKLILNLLTVQNIKVEEYTDNILTKEGYPGNWKDFTDICLSNKLPPSLCAIKINKNVVDVCFIKTTDDFLYTCHFEDDDVFSNLYTLLSEINAYELLCDNSKFVNLGCVTHIVKKSSDSKSMILNFLKKDNLAVREYSRLNICTLDNNLLESLNIYDILNNLLKCFTVQGNRLLLQFIKQPLKNKEEIEGRLNIVDEISKINLENLRDFPDLYKIIKKIDKLKINEIIKIYQIITNLPVLINKLNLDKLKDDFYTPLLNIYTSLSKLVSSISIYITDDDDLNFNNIIDQSLIKSLNKYNLESEEIYKKMLNICDKIKYNDGLLKLSRLEYKKYENILKKNNILILSITKSGINFTTKSLSEINLEKEKIKDLINKETNKILNELRTEVKKYINELEILNYIISLLDVFNAFSNLKSNPKYCRPVFNDHLDLEGAFHPLLENTDGNVILNNIKLNNNICILTGPNMGGKSTFLKMVGIISILGQVGCYVPCKYASLPIFDGIFIRIGANDSSVKGCSTFMMEMKDISRICRMSTSKSLVLIDELGRGTSEIDGLSIAKAVKDHLYNIKCTSIFATHYPELCDERSVNKKTLNDKLTLLYKIIDGVCDTSYGRNVAEIVGFPEDVLEKIKCRMNQN